MITEITTDKVWVGEEVKCRRITGIKHIEGKRTLPVPYIGSAISDKPAYWLVDSKVRILPKNRANLTFYVDKNGNYNYNKLERGELINHMYLRAPLSQLKEIGAFRRTLQDYPRERKLIVSTGDVFTESDFQKIVRGMNEAGKRLVGLRKDPWEGSFVSVI